MTRRLIVLLVVLLAAGAVWLLRPAGAPSVPDAVKRTTDASHEAARLVGRGDATSNDPVPARDAADESTDEDDADVGEGKGQSRTLHVRVFLGDEPAPAGVRVLLRVTAGEDDAPGAWSREARTDEHGTVRFDAAVGEDGWLCAWAEGYAPAVERWWWHEGREEDPLVVTLVSGIPFDGRVVDAETGRPIPGAGVVLDTYPWGVEVGPTDEAGYFHVPGLDAEEVRSLTARAPGYAACELYLVVDSGRVQPAVPVLRMQRSGVITGTVRAPDGRPVGSAEVRFRTHVQGPWSPWPPERLLGLARPSDRRLEWMQASDLASSVHAREDGSFRIEALEFGETYDVVACAAGHAASAWLQVRITESEPEHRIDLRLRRPGAVVLHVVPPEGAQLPSEIDVLVFRDWRPLRPDEEEARERFVFRAVVPGPAHGFVWAEGFAPASVPIDVREGETVEAEIRLVAGHRIEGLVIGPDGNAVPGAHVEVAPADLNAHERVDSLNLFGERSLIADSEGRFVVTGLPPREVVLVAYHGEDDDFEPRLATPDRVRCTPPARDVRLVLAHRGGIRLRVLGPSGAPYEGPVSVGVEDEDESGWWTEDLGEDGGTTFSGLADGEYRLVVTPRDLAWVARRFRIEGGAMVDLGDVVLGPGVTVSGRVVDDTGAPVAEADIQCTENGERQAVTDGDGRFSMDAFPDGGFNLRAQASGHVDESVEVQPGATTGLRIVLCRSAHVQGTLTLPEEEDRIGLWVELRRPGASSRMREQLAPDGETVLWRLYEGSEYLRVNADDRFEGDLRPGSYEGWLRDKAGGERRLGAWTFEAGETYDLELALPGK